MKPSNFLALKGLDRKPSAPAAIAYDSKVDDACPETNAVLGWRSLPSHRAKMMRQASFPHIIGICMSMKMIS
jgi:hypothetical protein